MHILFLTDNFPPEGNAPASRTFEHCREWVRSGHRVTVITGVPNFPEGKVFAGYRNKLYQSEVMDGIEVRRVITYITANEGFLRRTLDYLSFMVTAFIAGLFVKKPDVIVATSPQFFCACAGWMLSFLRRKPFVFELRDLWPASITAVGAMQPSRSTRALERLELFLYRRAKMIVSVTHSFKANLIARGIGEDKIKVVINGVDLTSFTARERNRDLASLYQLEDKFVAGYIGTHGMAHALETLLEAAELLKGRDDIVILLAGGGARLQAIQELADQKQLTNIRILGRQDKNCMPDIWSLCDISIVHLQNKDLFREVIPSKIFESFAMSLPVLIAVPEGEATSLVLQDNAGVAVEPENAVAIAESISQLADDRQYLKLLAENALGAATRYDRKVMAQKMLEYLTLIKSAVNVRDK